MLAWLLRLSRQVLIAFLIGWMTSLPVRLAAGDQSLPTTFPRFLAHKLSIQMMAPPDSYDAAAFADWATGFWGQFDQNGDGVTPDEVEYEMLAAPLAENRRKLRSADTNQDGDLQSDEVERIIKLNMDAWYAEKRLRDPDFSDPFPIEAERSYWKAVDSNGNLVIDAKEMEIAAMRGIDLESDRRLLPEYLQAFDIDPNRDNRVTGPEIAEMARALFAHADTDGDGFLSHDEVQAFRRQF